MKYKFSVIIPVYNAEKTIRRCLDSLLDQHYEQAEIILINDGSKDRSAEICRQYAAQYNCVVYIEQENRGASEARNAGLAVASGEYVTFVDSDDYVCKAYFSELEKDDSDFVVFSYNTIRTDSVIGYTFAQDLLDADIHLNRIIGVLKNRIAGPWNKRFKNSIIKQKHITFHKELIIGEDFIFGLEYMLACTTSRILPLRLYCVDETGTESITRAGKYEFSQFLLIYKHAFRIADECKWNDIDRQKLIQILDFLFCRTSFACAERYLDDRLDSQVSLHSIIQLFYEQSHPNVEPYNIVHAIMRTCIERKITFVFALVAYIHLFLRNIRK